MEKKSKNSLMAAATLLSSGTRAAVCTAGVHCAYYAVLQYMKHLLAHLSADSLSYPQQDALCRRHGNSSHAFILQALRDRMPPVPARRVRGLVEQVRLLKRERVEADYTPRTFTPGECAIIERHARAVIEEMKDIFKDKIL